MNKLQKLLLKFDGTKKNARAIQAFFKKQIKKQRKKNINLCNSREKLKKS